MSLALGVGLPARAESVTIAAASDLQFALADVVGAMRAERPGDTFTLIYGSSGKLCTQIMNGAPFDLFFSADITYPRRLDVQGLTAGAVHPYAVGRLVFWTLTPALAGTALKNLPASAVRKLAIANPAHAPYGQRAMEALQHEGVWDAMRPRLVLGDNIAQAAQFVASGAADAGIVALALVLSPPLAGKGSWAPIPAAWHSPLEQGFVVLERAHDNRLAHRVAEAMAEAPARAVLRRHGFVLPGDVQDGL